ncbi:unnamed protein product [Amoebophrya sp. A25]|nr:unnamed protein product [Amoebophrya sp. A25]|eukprot:GSA25T00002063001.1
MGDYVNIGESVPGQGRKVKSFMEEFMPASFGKTESALLREQEYRVGFTWDRLHAYKTIMELPVMPEAMPPGQVLDANDIPGCRNEYHGLDRCMVVMTANETRVEPFARMNECKPFFRLFDRCTRRRDRKMVEKVMKWEGQHYQGLSEAERKRYDEELQTKHDYFSYAIEHDPTPALKEKAQRDACHMEFRRANLENIDDPTAQKKLKQRLMQYVRQGGGKNSAWNRKQWEAHRVEWNKHSENANATWRPAAQAAKAAKESEDILFSYRKSETRDADIGGRTSVDPASWKNNPSSSGGASAAPPSGTPNAFSNSNPGVEEAVGRGQSKHAAPKNVFDANSPMAGG